MSFRLLHKFYRVLHGFNTQQNNRSIAFTLIELLAVIAVVFILAALLFPALSRARSAADSTVCKNNLRQIAVALQLYADDYGAYPLCAHSAPGFYYWHDTLAQYTFAKWPDPWTGFYQVKPNFRPTGLYVCPGFARLPNSFPTGSYGYNVNGVAPNFRRGWGLGLGGEKLTADGVGDGFVDWDAKTFRHNRDSEILHPSDMIAVGDAEFGKSPKNPFFPDLSEKLMPYEELNVSLQSPSVVLPGLQSVQNLRHRGKLNIVFCDGHVEYMRFELLFARQDELLKRWNNDNQSHRELVPY